MGDKILFWVDCWASDQPLRILFPSIFAIELQKEILLINCYDRRNGVLEWVWRWRRQRLSDRHRTELKNCLALISSVQISCNSDKWLWKGSDDSNSFFLVKSLRWEIDNLHLPVLNFTCWLKGVPLKINCFIWRLLLDHISTKRALSTRGVILDNLQCVLCGNFEETSQHLMIHCCVSKWVWSIIHDWVKLPKRVNFDTLEEILDFPKKSIKNKEECRAVQSISMVVCWMIWKARNDVIFNNVPFQMSKIVNDIKSASFLWVKHRCKRPSLEWEKWCKFNFVNFPL
ncbi:uncharacterized protein LOC143581588 [Bidens hawaiensis]|uniref:uncharacterized protein LOC143581588 n=1 Tax=Bidens hawaiensis TaxID=980011 RepID=UPI0040497F5E